MIIKRKANLTVFCGTLAAATLGGCGTIDSVRDIGGGVVDLVSAATDKDLHSQIDHLYLVTDKANADISATSVHMLQDLRPDARSIDLATQLGVSNSVADLGDRNMARTRVVEGVRLALNDPSTLEAIKVRVKDADTRRLIFNSLNDQVVACNHASKTFEEVKPTISKVTETSYKNSATAYFIKPATWLAEMNSTTKIGDLCYSIARSTYLLLKLANVDTPMDEPPESGGFHEFFQKTTEGSTNH